MDAVVVAPAIRVDADLRVPGDKSIAHRALILAALAQGVSRIHGIPEGADVQATMACLQALGVSLRGRDGGVEVMGEELTAWRTPADSLYCANSGTTMRVLAGALSASAARATLTGDASLQRRPMDRVVEPLRRMGARITADGGRAPIRVEGGPLTGCDHRVSPPSAQVKTALILAALHAASPTSVMESVRTRDHTERLLTTMGARLDVSEQHITVQPLRRPLNPLDLVIPGDFSSAAFLLAAGALRPGWRVTVLGVGLNPSRTAFLDILREMGAEVSAELESPSDDAREPRGRITVRGQMLRAVRLHGEQVARAIDEVPVILALASQAEGRTVIDDAAELRIKESDRIAAMANGLRQMSARVEEWPDGMAIVGPCRLHAAAVDAAGDHRIAMALAVAALAADGRCTIKDGGTVAVSYPRFFDDLRDLSGGSH